MKNTILHKANTRGNADFGWLKTHYTFSFADYFDENRMHFGALRVLNDDYIQSGMGFGTHPHKNMEIISVVRKGVLQHKDSMGNAYEITENEIQVMSAGIGIYHSEHSKANCDNVELFQIWIIPNQQNVTPRYQQITYQKTENSLQQIVSPYQDDEGTWIHQNAWLHLANIIANNSIQYQKKAENNGLYILVISGNVIIEKESESIELQKRDGLGITNFSKISLQANQNTELLLIEIPMIEI